MYYSLLERHNDGSWWYHRYTFTDRAKAEAYLKEWIYWDEDREKTIIEHKDAFPKETLWTYNLKDYYNIAGELLCTVKERGEDIELNEYMYGAIRDAIKDFARNYGGLQDGVEKYRVVVDAYDADGAEDGSASYEVSFRCRMRQTRYQGDRYQPTEIETSYRAAVHSIVLARWVAKGGAERTAVAFKPELLVVEDEFYQTVKC